MQERYSAYSDRLRSRDEIAEVIYDRLVYEAQPDGQLNFFRNPIGQGVTAVPGRVGPKTEADTNMYLANKLPAGQEFYVTSVGMIFLPALGLNKRSRLADVNAAARSGVVRFAIQNRGIVAQLTEQFRDSDYAAFGGKPFELVPTVIQSGQYFTVMASDLAPLPSGRNGELWCRMRGRLLRQVC